MENWNKFSLAVLRHPKLRSFRSPARIKILEFVELSCRYEQKGVVAFLDDEIALDLNIPLHHWLSLRDLMMERGVVRQVPRADSLIYEVAFWMLPSQADTGGRVVDGRSLETWLASMSEPVDAFSDNADDPALQKARLLGAERTALCRFRAKIRREQNRLPTLSESHIYLMEYRAERQAVSGDVTPETGDSDVTDDVTLQQGVTGTTTEENLLDERDNNNSEVGAEAQACNTVTDVTCYTDVTNVTSPVDPQEEKAVVVALLSENGKDYALSVAAAERVVGEYGAARCRKQFEWLQYRKPPKPEQGSRSGQLLKSIVDNWREPPGAIAARKEAERCAAEVRKRQAIAEQNAAASEALEIQQFRREQLWNDLSDGERRRIDAIAERSLSEFMEHQLLASRQLGKAVPQLVRLAIEAARWRQVDALMEHHGGLACDDSPS